MHSPTSTHQRGQRRLASRYRRQWRRRRWLPRHRPQPATQRITKPLGLPATVEGVVVSVEDHYLPPKPPPRRGRPALVLAAIAALSLAMGAGVALLLTPFLLGTATITLTPEAHTLSTATSIPVAARLFPAQRESLSRTIATTGTATRPAIAAHGVITFFNGLPAPQTIPAGTLLMSASGVPVLTEEVAYIPAASPPTEGATTVSARAENTGSAGNIAAGSIGGPCCRAYVLAYNGGFWGGADARTYRTPTAHDIAGALAPLRHQLDSRVQVAIHTWLDPGEVLLPPNCTTTKGSSAQPGAEASHVTVTVGETCSAAAYNQRTLQQVAIARLGTIASQQLGAAYGLAGEFHADVTAAKVTNDHITLQARISGVYLYRFSARQLANLRAELAGLSRNQATAILVRVEGVTQARIQSLDTLPDDPARIHVLLALPAP